MSAGRSLTEHIRGRHVHGDSKRWEGTHYTCVDCRPRVIFWGFDEALDEKTTSHMFVATSVGIYEFETDQVVKWLDENAPTAPSLEPELNISPFKSIDVLPVDVPSTNLE